MGIKGDALREAAEQGNAAICGWLRGDSRKKTGRSAIGFQGKQEREGVAAGKKKK